MKMTPNQAIIRVNRNFTYKTDEKAFGIDELWTIPTELPFKGDCEDYILAILYQMTGSIRGVLKMLLTGKARIHFLNTVEGDGGHVSLEVDGRYTDSILQYWGRRDSLPSQTHLRYQYRMSRFRIVQKLVRGAILKLAVKVF